MFSVTWWSHPLQNRRLVLCLLKGEIPEPGNYLTYPAFNGKKKENHDQWSTQKVPCFFLKEWDIYVIVRSKRRVSTISKEFWEDQFVFSPRQGWNPWNVVSQVSFQDLPNILCLAVLWIILPFFGIVVLFHWNVAIVFLHTHRFNRCLK